MSSLKDLRTAMWSLSDLEQDLAVAKKELRAARANDRWEEIPGLELDIAVIKQKLSALLAQVQA